jgi:hypothetical protein
LSTLHWYNLHLSLEQQATASGAGSAGRKRERYYAV